MAKEKQKKENEREEEVSTNIIKTDYSEMMSRSYIDYAMSVITDRAVPDVRDGLKPVQRRILYDMGCELHLSPNGPYRKSARIVGDTMGKFHPHGDSSIYDAMVVMSQDFKKEVPLIDGHGNFGSIEGDGAAASRYCLAGDMRINTNLGLIKMEDIVPESQLNSDNEINIKVVSLFEHVEVADRLFNSGIHPTKRITLDNGMTFRGSFNHPIAIIKDGNFQWKTLSHLKEGDVAAVPLNVKNLSNRNNISDADIFDCAVSTAGELEDIDEEIMLSDSSIQRQFIGHCFGIGAQIKTTDKIPSLFLKLSDGAAKDMQLLLQMQGVLSSIRFGGVFIDSSSSLKTFYENVQSLDKCGEVLARRRDTDYEPYPFNETYAFVPVSRIENTGMEPVYSVRVRSKDHSFTACGVINHNTEARLTPISEEAFINDVSEDTVSFAPNYDETTKEPEILPALIPNFIINGSEGIAVGMTTSTPPHNLSEAIACEKYLMKHPAAKTEALMRYVSGPDFPTGGIVINKKDLENIYETGQGKIKIRGKIAHETNDENGKSINRLVITEIPYTMIGAGISKFLCDLSELADKREIPDVVDISNQSSKDGIRIVIDLKKSADFEKIEALIYAKTKLEDTFAVNILAIVDKKPMTLGLKDALMYHLQFIRDVERKKYASLLKKTKEKLEIEEGLLKAISEIDAVIEAIRGSRSRAAAKKCMTTGDISGISFKTKRSEKIAEKFNYSSIQADAILDMRLSRLVSLEISTLQKEKEKTEKEAKEYALLISDSAALDKDISQTLSSFSSKYGRKRRTEIIDAEEIKIEKEEEKPYPAVVLIDRFNYARAVSEEVYEKNKEAAEKENKFIVHLMSTDRLILFCESGSAYGIDVKKIPFGKFRDKPAVIDMISAFNTEKDVILKAEKADEKDTEKEFLILTSGGKIKRMRKTEISGKGRQARYIALSEGERVVAFSEISTEEKGKDVVLLAGDRAIRFSISNVPVQGKAGSGVAGISASKESEAKSFFVVDDEKTEISEGVFAGSVPVQRRGGKGKKIEELRQKE